MNFKAVCDILECSAACEGSYAEHKSKKPSVTISIKTERDTVFFSRMKIINCTNDKVKHIL